MPTVAPLPPFEKACDSEPVRSTLAAVTGLVALAACGDDRYIFIETQPVPLAAADPARWAVQPAETEFANPGTFAYAHPIALRFGIESVVNHDVTQIETASAVITAVETRLGTLCEVSVLPTCQGTTCEAEISVLGAGNCLIKIRAVTPDGERRGACWRHGQYEIVDPANSPEAVAVIEARDAEEFETCLASL